MGNYKRNIKASMPLYEMVMVARVGEQKALVNCLKAVSGNVLSNGGVVRSLDNLGDRVLVKHLRAKDGQRYSVGRFIKAEFDATPQVMSMVESAAREHDEVLRVNTNKMKEAQYMNRAMKRLNQELSPFRDKSEHDEEYIRAMWTKYTQLQALRQGSTPKEIAREIPRVAAFVKGLQDGPEHQDTQTLRRHAEGELEFEDKRVRDYYIQ